MTKHSQEQLSTSEVVWWLMSTYLEAHPVLLGREGQVHLWDPQILATQGHQVPHPGHVSQDVQVLLLLLLKQVKSMCMTWTSKCFLNHYFNPAFSCLPEVRIFPLLQTRAQLEDIKFFLDKISWYDKNISSFKKK